MFWDIPSECKVLWGIFSKIWRLPLGACHLRVWMTQYLWPLTDPSLIGFLDQKHVITCVWVKESFFASDKQEVVVIIVLTSKEREKLNHIIKMEITTSDDFGNHWVTQLAAVLWFPQGSLVITNGPTFFPFLFQCFSLITTILVSMKKKKKESYPFQDRGNLS